MSHPPADPRRLSVQRQDTIMQRALRHGSVTVAELSQELGVSPMTVRRDITALVDDGKLARVHGGAVLPKGTSTPKSARQLARIGLIVPAARYYYPQVISGAVEAASRSGMRLVLADSQYDPEEEQRLVERMLRAQVDALLVATALPPQEHPPKWLQDLKVPVVLVERQWNDADLEFVRTDHAAGARLAVAYLRRLGHRRVGLGVRNSTPTAPWLVSGFVEATSDGEVQAGFDPVDLSLPAGEPLAARDQSLDRLLTLCRETDTAAVLVHNDDDAVALLGLAADRGVRVPEDLAVVAYDDEVAALAPTPLTAVAPPKQEVGEAAVELAVRRLRSGPLAAAHQVSLVPRLVERSSTSPVRD